MYWYSDDRSIQFKFNRQKSGLNKAFYGHRSSSIFSTNILKYRLDCHLQSEMLLFQLSFMSSAIAQSSNKSNQFNDEVLFNIREVIDFFIRV